MKGSCERGEGGREEVGRGGGEGGGAAEECCKKSSVKAHLQHIAPARATKEAVQA